MLALMRSFTYTHHDSFSEDFVSTLLMIGLVRSFFHNDMLFLVRSVSYTPGASFSVEFYVHSSC